MIRPQVLQEFARRFAISGFDAGAFLPSYGLAEATLAVTMAPLGARALRTELGTSCRGRALRPGARLRWAMPSRSRCRRQPVAGALRRPGVRARPQPDERLSALSACQPPAARPRRLARHRRSRLSGRGELVVTGRHKDLIILGGRNIWPQDLEWAAEQVAGVRAGDVAAFSLTRGRRRAGAPDRRVPAGGSARAGGPAPDDRRCDPPDGRCGLRGRAGGAAQPGLHDLRQAQPVGREGGLPGRSHPRSRRAAAPGPAGRALPTARAA